MATLTLPNGVTLTGDYTQVMDTASKLGFNPEKNGYYFSESHGWVRIADMDKMHVRNAMLKRYRSWAASLNQLSDVELYAALTNGPTHGSDAEIIRALFARFVQLMAHT